MITIKDLPILDPIQAHFLNSKPLDNDFATAIQETTFYEESRNTKPEYFRILENLLAYQLKFNTNSVFFIKQEAIDKYGQDVINNASRYFSNLRLRNNIQPASLQIAAIAWFIDEMIDIEKTKEQNKWELKVWTPVKK
jgi:hypothetical protein